MSKLLVKRSNCCNSGVDIMHSLLHGMLDWHKCLECKKPCGVHVETWDVDGMGEDEEAQDNI